MSEIDCENTVVIVCPYCGYEHLDSWECGESDDEFQCHHCEKVFAFESEVTITYSSYKKGD